MTPAPAAAWHAGRWSVGTQVRWRGVALVCCSAHVLPPGARHPWDAPGLIPQDACLLWAPAGAEECKSLQRLIIDNRQRFSERTRLVLSHAAGAGAA
jgi:hypothetical protein